jgi:hypothetical protein
MLSRTAAVSFAAVGSADDGTWGGCAYAADGRLGDHNGAAEATTPTDTTNDEIVSRGGCGTGENTRRGCT